MEETEDDYLIYFEKQQAALCGVHAINTLLQAPLMTEVELSEIAQQLDQIEHSLMAQEGITPEYINFVAQGSANVASDGNFSIQVLSRALSIFGLSAIPLTSPEASLARSDPLSQSAYLCNLHEHWFTVRHIHNQWWDLNSLYSAPKPLSPFYLSAFLDSLRQQGYTIFVIRGTLPTSNPGDVDINSSRGAWIPASEARFITEESQNTKKRGVVQAALGSIMDIASKKGTKITLQSLSAAAKEFKKSLDGRGVSPEEDEELRQALAESKREAELRNQHYQFDPDTLYNDSGMDDELRAAIAASLKEIPPHKKSNANEEGQNGGSRSTAEGASLTPIGTAGIHHNARDKDSTTMLPKLGDEPNDNNQPGTIIHVSIRLPSGERHSRRFNVDDSVAHVVAFAVKERTNNNSGVDVSKMRLVIAFPERRVLDDWSLLLKDCFGVDDKRVMLFVEQ